VLKTLSSYNGVLSSGPEDPDFDSLTRLTVLDLFNPSASFGVVVTPRSWLKIGATVQLPMVVDAEGTVEVQLPASPVYDASSVVGQAADVRFSLPWSLALGVELRPLAGLRVELDLRWERWSSASSDCPAAQLGGSQAAPAAPSGCEILISPKDIFILEIPGIPRYKVPDLAERLGYQDALSVHIGAEYRLPLRVLAMTVRAGYAFERGAVPAAARSVIANDPDKHFVTLGGSLTFGRLRLDAGYGLVASASAAVDYRQSEARQTNPINPSDAATVGGGSYTLVGHIVGVGLEVEL
jgi:long-subunit fatty acid transport protein